MSRRVSKKVIKKQKHASTISGKHLLFMFVLLPILVTMNFVKMHRSQVKTILG